MSFNPPVFTMPKRIPDLMCNKIIRHGISLQPKTAVIRESDVDEKLRRSNVSWFHNELWIAKWIIDGVKGVCQQVGWDTTWPESIQFTVYNAPDGHYTWHQDCYDKNHKDYKAEKDIYSKQRKVSIVCNITDPSEYEGGQLEIVDPSKAPDDPEEERIIKISKERGQVCVFPSFLYHRVTPITKGTRYSLVCWLRGPEFR